MIVALTGTPGTGKSTVGKQLEDHGYTVISLNELAKSQNLLLAYDKRRATHEVDLDGLDDHLAKLFADQTANDKPVTVLESHIAHLLSMTELVLILRCHPDQLRVRLGAGGKAWHEDKIRENLEAEALDVITIECVEHYPEDKIFELDTTNEPPSKTAQRIIEIISSGGCTDDYRPGNIDWSEEILKWY